VPRVGGRAPSLALTARIFARPACSYGDHDLAAEVAGGDKTWTTRLFPKMPEELRMLRNNNELGRRPVFIRGVTSDGDMDMLLLVTAARDSLLSGVSAEVLAGEGGGIKTVADLATALDTFSRAAHRRAAREAGEAPSAYAPVTGAARVLSLRIGFVQLIQREGPRNRGPRGDRPGSYRKVTATAVHPTRREIVVSGTMSGEIVAVNLARASSENTIWVTVDAGAGRRPAKAHNSPVAGLWWAEDGDECVLVSRTDRTVSVWGLSQDEERLARRMSATAPAGPLAEGLSVDELLAWVHAAEGDDE